MDDYEIAECLPLRRDALITMKYEEKDERTRGAR